MPHPFTPSPVEGSPSLAQPSPTVTTEPSALPRAPRAAMVRGDRGTRNTESCVTLEHPKVRTREVSPLGKKQSYPDGLVGKLTMTAPQ